MEQSQINLDTIATWRKEIQGYWEIMEEFDKINDVERILRLLSAWSARSGHIHNLVIRSSNRMVTEFRTKEIDHFHDEVETQFKIWSRIGTVSQSEWEMSR